MALRIITDSTAYLEQAFIEKHGITVIPLTYLFDGAVCEEGLPGTYDAVYARIRAGAALPRTSQPPLGAYYDAFEQALAGGNHVLGVFLSSKISGTYATACAAAKSFANPNLVLVDSHTSAFGLRLLIEKALERHRKGQYFKQIVDGMIADSARIRVELVVENLDCLIRGGRLTGAAAAAGKLLGIVPVIALKDGALGAAGKFRGQQRALADCMARIPAGVSRIGVMHVMAPERAQAFAQKLQARFPQAKIDFQQVGPIVGGHVGPGAIGLCYEEAPGC